ncbi:MAG TPA: hypothetical protein VL241_09940 [Gemmatimonadales bacterium]|nr:hypothetical protein [Gemmatimonadales bacterium]
MRYLLLFAMLSGFSSTLAAQGPQPADLDRRVWVRERLASGGHRGGVKGTLEGIAGDTLFIRPVSGAMTLAVAPGDGRTVLYYNGRRSSLGRGALIGTGIGATLGAVIGLTTGEDCGAGGEFLCFDRGTLAAAGALTLGAGGLAVGLIAGALSSHEVWTERRAVRARPLVVATPEGVRVGLGIRF